MKVKLIFIGLFLSISLLSSAQLVHRREKDGVHPDDFWRKRVTIRVDTHEKVNRPFLDAHPDPLYVPGDTKYGTNTSGLAQALIVGWFGGAENVPKYVCYDQDLVTPRSKEKFMTDMKVNGASTGVDTTQTDTTGGEPTTDDGGGDDLGGDFGGDAYHFSEKGLSSLGHKLAQYNFSILRTKRTNIQLAGPGGFDANQLSKLCQYLDLEFNIIEDRVFDKVQSRMFFYIQYIQLIIVSPTTGKETVVATFKYSDIADWLGNVQWRNRFNEAEDKSLKDIFDLRLFNGYISTYSYDGTLQTLTESEQRRQQMIQFEHELWSF